MANPRLSQAEIKTYLQQTLDKQSQWLSIRYRAIRHPSCYVLQEIDLVLIALAHEYQELEGMQKRGNDS